MWSDEIEKAYQDRIECAELSHPLDIKYFYKFVWLCINNPSGAPDEVEFRERLAKDRDLPPDEQGFPHPVVSKWRFLYVHLPEFTKWLNNK